MLISLHSSTVLRRRHNEVLAEVERAAAAGLSGYWAPMLNGMDTLTTLALAGASVPRIELGTAIVPLPLRTPYALAQQAITIQDVTGGRLVLGLGTSHPDLVRDLFGAEWSAPIGAMSAYLQALMPLLEGRPEGALPTAARRPPVVVGAVNPRMANVAAEMADGIVTWSAGLRTLEQVVIPVADRRTANKPFRVIVSLPVCVTDDVAAARALIGSRLGANDALPSYRKVMEREDVNGVAQLALVGNEAEVSAQLTSFASAGATEFAAHIVAVGSDVDRTWALLTREAEAV